MSVAAAGQSGYCVEMRCTIMWMMREPRGQLHRSMLGLRILSSSSWSSSQRSSFTSSATYVREIHKRTDTHTVISDQLCIGKKTQNKFRIF